MRNISLLLFLFSLIGCSSSATHKELEEVKSELEKTRSLLASTQQELKALKEDESGQFTHIVFFKVKSGADQEALIAEIKRLEAIEGVKDLEVGPFKNLDDPRALLDYHMMMEMSFDNVEAYKKYQAHPIHLTLKENTKDFMSGPPATYDYTRK